MMSRFSIAWPGAPLALASAVLFGASTPAAKFLLGEGVAPGLLAGLLYLGAGLGLGAFLAVKALANERSKDAPLRRSDLPRLAAVVICGGVIGPLLLMIGLQSTAGSSAALLLNVESLATMGIAWIVFRENVDRRLLLGAAAILAGALLLSWQGPAEPVGLGALAIIGACIAWGIDNNLTQKLSSADPVQITAIKGLVAGAVNVSLALWQTASIPSFGVIFYAGIVGLFGYGISLVLFVTALRHLGSARTGAYFSSAPFVGSALSVVLFNDPLTWQLAAAAALMITGLYLHITELHDHEHHHEAAAHDHSHVHDLHHQHAHEAGQALDEPHSHWHRHAPLVHRHPHYPDLHHRHDHDHPA